MDDQDPDLGSGAGGESSDGLGTTNMKVVEHAANESHLDLDTSQNKFKTCYHESLEYFTF